MSLDELRRAIESARAADAARCDRADRQLMTCDWCQSWCQWDEHWRKLAGRRRNRKPLKCSIRTHFSDYGGQWRNLSDKLS